MCLQLVFLKLEYVQGLIFYCLIGSFGQPMMLKHSSDSVIELERVKACRCNVNRKQRVIGAQTLHVDRRHALFYLKGIVTVEWDCSWRDVVWLCWRHFYSSSSYYLYFLSLHATLLI